MTFVLDRRSALAGATGLALLGGRAMAVPAAPGTRFLLVFLRGAYDAANVIAPASNAFYHEARPTLALAPPDPANPQAALPLDADWSLHPALRDSIAPLWASRQIAFVPFAGTDDMSRSHFETQDSIEMGQPIVRPAALWFGLHGPAGDNARRQSRSCKSRRHDRIFRHIAAGHARRTDDPQSGAWRQWQAGDRRQRNRDDRCNVSRAAFGRGRSGWRGACRLYRARHRVAHDRR